MLTCSHSSQLFLLDHLLELHPRQLILSHWKGPQFCSTCLRSAPCFSRRIFSISERSQRGQESLTKFLPAAESFPASLGIKPSSFCIPLLFSSYHDRFSNLSREERPAGTNSPVELVWLQAGSAPSSSITSKAQPGPSSLSKHVRPAPMGSTPGASAPAESKTRAESAQTCSSFEWDLSCRAEVLFKTPSSADAVKTTWLKWCSWAL